MNAITAWEQKLASLKPRLNRDIVMEISLESAWEKNRHRFKSYCNVGVACFLLGAIAMYVMMTCFFDRQTGQDRPLIAQTQPASFPAMLDESDLVTLRSPVDLIQMMNRKTEKIPKPKHPEPDYTRARLMREFLP